jgi:predicted AAA+ superfamily ATPase
LPIEVKYRTRVGAGDLAGLRTCMRALKRSRGLVVSKGTTASKETEEGEIDIVPAWEFLLDTAATEGP